MEASPDVDNDNAARRRARTSRLLRLTLWQAIGGIGLPVFSAVVQGWVLDVDFIGPWLIWGYAAFGICALSLSIGGWSGKIPWSLICGANAGCAAGGWLTGAIHALFSHPLLVLFLFLPLAILPCVAAGALASRAATIWVQVGGLRLAYVALGALVAFSLPATAHFAETWWVRGKLAQLSSDDPRLVVAALHALDAYPLRFGRFRDEVCQDVVFGSVDWYSDENFRRQVTDIVGPAPETCQPPDPNG